MFRRSLYLALAVSIFTAVSVFADDSSNGCGLGWAVTKKKSMLATTTRGSTNSIIPNTFGMTSGTSHCDSHSFAKNELPAYQYIETNYDMLMVDVAKGQGEYLDGFAAVLGCTGSGVDQLNQAVRSDLQTSKTSSPIQMFEGLKQHSVPGCSVLSG